MKNLANFPKHGGNRCGSAPGICQRVRVDEDFCHVVI